MTRITTACLAAALALTLSACGSAPKPTSELALTKSALQAAEGAGAREYAPIELRKAREKKSLADKAMAKENYEKARRLTLEAQADAELAKAKAEAQKSSLALKEVQDSIQLMRSELIRASGKQ